MTSSANHGFGRVPDAFLDTLKDRTDVVALIGRQVELKKAGATYKGLCPFHSERSARPRPTRKTVWSALTEAARRAPATAANLAQTIVPLLDLSAPNEAAFCQLLTDLARQAGTPPSDVAGTSSKAQNLTESRTSPLGRDLMPLIY